MWDFFHFANLARKGLIKFGEGKIKITNLRVLLMDVKTLNGLEEELEKVFGYKTAGQFIYRVSKEGGRRAASSHYIFSGYSRSDLMDYLEKMATGAGWGKIKIQKKFEDGGIVIVENSPFIKKGKGVPTCHFLRGCFAGAGEYIGRHPVDCIEIECKSAGAKKCRFIATATSKLKKMKDLKPLHYQIEKIGPESIDI